VFTRSPSLKSNTLAPLKTRKKKRGAKPQGGMQMNLCAHVKMSLKK